MALLRQYRKYLFMVSYSHNNKIIRNPSQWVRRCTQLIHVQETALDLACGHGRHGRYLLSKGCNVTFVDSDISGLSDLKNHLGANIICANLENDEPFPLIGQHFDCVVVTNYLWRDIFPLICNMVTTSGLLIYETFACGNQAFGRPRNSNFLLRDGELKEVVNFNFQILGYEQGLRTSPTPAIIQRIAAIRL